MLGALPCTAETTAQDRAQGQVQVQVEAAAEAPARPAVVAAAVLVPASPTPLQGFLAMGTVMAMAMSSSHRNRAAASCAQARKLILARRLQATLQPATCLVP